MCAIIWGGPKRSDAFNEHDVVNVERYDRPGTIVSGVRSHPGLQDAVYVEFTSGEGLPGNDPVQTVPVSDLRHIKGAT